MVQVVNVNCAHLQHLESQCGGEGKQMAFFMPVLWVLLFLKPADGLTCVCSNCIDSTNCTVDEGGRCFLHVWRDLETDEITSSSGCLASHTVLLHCSPNNANPASTTLCCTDQDFCNSELGRDVFPSSNSRTDDSIDGSAGTKEESISHELEGTVIAVAAAGACLVGFLSLCLSVVVCVRRRYFQRRRLEVTERIRMVPAASFAVDIRRLTEESISSGSGSGDPHLSPRTISQHLRLTNRVGQGRFGEVWRAEWQKRAVAVKIFHSREEESWLREIELYQMPMLRHNSVLGFIAADLYSTGSQTQLWLITDYHANGSVYDFLQGNTIDLPMLHRMALSTVSGLAHLHAEIVGVQGKPAIAHRDLKSRNVLVKKDGTCAIADLGLAVKDENTLHIDAQLLKSGTRRYMAPEVLDESINDKDFNSFRKADVYSLGLILWEMTRRCYTDGIAAHKYEPPYSSAVTGNPSSDDMRYIVCVQYVRPPLPEDWDRQSELRMYSKLMRECWSGNSAARLTATRVKKTLLHLSGDESC